MPLSPLRRSGAMPGGTALRAVCDVCGYKNPRDVAVCMKCGEKTPRNAGGDSPHRETCACSVTDAYPGAVARTRRPRRRTRLRLKHHVEIPIMKLVAGLWSRFWSLADLLSLSGRGKSGTLLAPRRALAVPGPSRRVARTSHQTQRIAKHYARKPVSSRNDQPEAAAFPGVTKRPTHPTETTPQEPQRTEAASYRVVAEAPR